MAPTPFSVPSLPTQLEAAPAALAERTLKQEKVLQGSFLQAWRDEIMLPDGSTATREYVRHSGAVVVAAQLPDGRYLVEYQYRYPMQRAMIELPAGKIDKGEEGLRCAQRELLEETGFMATQWAFAGTMHNCIAYSDEHIDIWFAKGLQHQGQKLDEGEFLQIYAASLPDLMQRVLQGQLTDAKTISALLWMQQVESETWPLQWQSSDDTTLIKQKG